MDDVAVGVRAAHDAERRRIRTHITGLWQETDSVDPHLEQARLDDELRDDLLPFIGRIEAESLGDDGIVGAEDAAPFAVDRRKDGSDDPKLADLRKKGRLPEIGRAHV